MGNVETNNFTKINQRPYIKSNSAGNKNHDLQNLNSFQILTI